MIAPTESETLLSRPSAFISFFMDFSSDFNANFSTLSILEKSIFQISCTRFSICRALPTGSVDFVASDAEAVKDIEKKAARTKNLIFFILCDFSYSVIKLTVSYLSIYKGEWIFIKRSEFSKILSVNKSFYI